jgi:hypothetical protein
MSRTSASVMGREMLWIGAATVGLLLAIAHLSIRANFSPAQSMGYAPLWLMGIWLAGLLAVGARMVWKLN